MFLFYFSSCILAFILLKGGFSFHQNEGKELLEVHLNSAVGQRTVVLKNNLVVCKKGAFTLKGLQLIILQL